jgi:hypothetical protein
MATSLSRFLRSVVRTLTLSLNVGAVVCAVGVATARADGLVAPPYLVAGTNHIIVGVVWDETAVRRALPAWVTPVEGMTGAINIYQAERGYGLTPYQSAYFWVDVEGYDSPSGVKGRWMLQGVYGPDEKTSAALKQYSGLPVRNGTSRFEQTSEGKAAIGTVNGQDFVTVVIKPSNECEAGAVTLNYPTTKGLIEIPAAGTVCKAEPVSATVHAPKGDPFAAFTPLKVTWAIEFKDGAFSIARPRPLGQ